MEKQKFFNPGINDDSIANIVKQMENIFNWIQDSCILNYFEDIITELKIALIQLHTSIYNSVQDFKSIGDIFYNIKDIFNLIKEKKVEIWISPITKVPIPQENTKRLGEKP